MTGLTSKPRLDVLGYFEPGHIERVFHIQGRSGALARSTRTHEQSHENLTSWTTLGLYQTILGLARSKLSRNSSAYNLITRCLSVTTAASRWTHEGFATFAQLKFIATRLGPEAFQEALSQLSSPYLTAAVHFRDLERALLGDELIDPDAATTATRSFAIAALAVNILRSASFDLQTPAELGRYFELANNHPDSRFLTFRGLALRGEVQPLLAAIRPLLRNVTLKVADRADIESVEETMADFSRSINRVVLEHLSAQMPIDVSAEFDPDERWRLMEDFTNAVAVFCKIDPTPLLNRWRRSRTPWRDKIDIVNFVDAPNLAHPVESLDALLLFLRNHPSNKTILGLHPLDLEATRWLAFASTKSSTKAFREELATCVSSGKLVDIVNLAHDVGVPLTAVDVLIDTLSEHQQKTLLNVSVPLYLFCALPAVSRIEEILRKHLHADCDITLLREAIDHYSVILASGRHAHRHLVAVVHETTARKCDYWLGNQFGQPIHKIVTESDLIVMLVTWMFTYGPGGSLVQGLHAELL